MCSEKHASATKPLHMEGVLLGLLSVLWRNSSVNNYDFRSLQVFAFLLLEFRFPYNVPSLFPCRKFVFPSLFCSLFLPLEKS